MLWFILGIFVLWAVVAFWVERSAADRVPYDGRDSRTVESGGDLGNIPSDSVTQVGLIDESIRPRTNGIEASVFEKGRDECRTGQMRLEPLA